MKHGDEIVYELGDAYSAGATMEAVKKCRLGLALPIIGFVRWDEHNTPDLIRYKRLERSHI